MSTTIITTDISWLAHSLSSRLGPRPSPLALQKQASPSVSQPRMDRYAGISPSVRMYRRRASYEEREKNYWGKSEGTL
ncbi:hypothetical protein LZ554_006118 [Drepanopeziza brunnea f. sp. 'monogermtubi']|nr:hypothetical protein LZ554_006118 [Drepanopeziza brunnea f. sp. 'monogermtubi']